MYLYLYSQRRSNSILGHKKKKRPYRNQGGWIRVVGGMVIAVASRRVVEVESLMSVERVDLRLRLTTKNGGGIMKEGVCCGMKTQESGM